MKATKPKASKEKIRTNQLLAAIRAVNRLMLQENDIENLIRKTCKTLTDNLGYFNVWIGLSAEEGGHIIKTASAGFDDMFPKLEDRLNKGELPKCTKKAVNSIGMVLIEDPVSECEDCPLSEKYQGRSGYCKKLSYSGRSFGLITASMNKEFFEDEQEQEIFSELADDLAFTISKIEESAELMESENKFSQIVEHAFDPVFLTAPDGSIILANPAACKLFGYSEDEFKKLGRSAVVDTDDPRLKAELQQRAEKGHFNGVLTFVKKNGSKFQGEISTVIFKDKDGNQKTSMTIRNIEDRLKAEQELRESGDKMKSIFRAAPVGIGMVKDRVFQEVNDRFCEITGYRANELIGKDARMIYPDKKEYEWVGKEKYKQILEKGTGTVITHFKQKDGKIIDVVLSSTLLKRGDISAGVTFTALDVTEQKRNAIELEEKARILNETGRQARIGGWEHDLVNGTAKWTDALHEIIEIPFSAKPPGPDEHLDFYKEPHRSRLRAAYENAINKHQSFELELQVVTANNKEIWCFVKADPIVEDGKCVKVRGIFQDISDHKAAEKALNESLIKYKTLFENYPMGVTVSDRTGKIIESNTMAEKLLGLPGKEHRKRTIDSKAWRIIRSNGSAMPPEEFASVRALNENRLIENVEMGIVKNDDKITWLNVSACPIPLKSLGVLITYHDISEQKYFNEQLLDSKNKLTAVFNNTSDLQLLVRYDSYRKFVVVAINQAYLDTANLFGLNFTEKDFIDIPLQDVITKALGLGQDVVEYTVNNYQKAVDEGKPYRYEESIEVAGQPYHSIITLSPIFDAEKKCTWILYNSHDVTAEREAILKLKASEEKYRLLADNVSDVIWAFNFSKEKFTYISPSVFQMRGYTAEEAINEKMEDSLTPDSAKKVQILIQNRLQEFQKNPHIKKYYLDEFHQKCKDGSVICIETSTHFHVNINGELEVIGISRDISDRKKTEESLRLSEQNFADIFESVHEGIAYMTRKGVVVKVNRALLEMIGGTQKDFVGKNIVFLTKKLLNVKNTKIVLHQVKNLLAGKSTSDFRVEYKNKTLQINGIINKKTGNITGVLRDITDQITVQKQLEDSELKHRLLFENAGLGIGYFSTWGKVLGFNKKACEDMGGKQSDFVGKSMVELYGEKEGHVYMSRLRKAVKSGEVTGYEDKLVLPTGPRWYYSIYARVQDAAGNIVGVQIISDDISQLKQTEVSLQQSETRFRELFNHMGNGVMVLHFDQLTEDFKIRDINSSGLTILGRKKREVINKSLVIIQKNVEKSGLLSILNTVYREEKPKFHPVVIEHDNKIEQWLDVHVYKLPTGEIVAVYKDITDRVNAEANLMESQRRLMVAQNIAKMGDFSWDVETNEVEWSDGLYELLRYDKKQQIDFAKVNEGIHHPDDLDRVLNWLQSSIASGKKFLPENEYRVRKSNGEVIYVKTVGVIRYRENKKPIIFATVQDITDQKKTKQDLEQKVDQLQRMNRAMVGRELRMIELKEEINNLCVKHGLEPPYLKDIKK